jgi:hypothetical protein
MWQGKRRVPVAVLAVGLWAGLPLAGAEFSVPLEFDNGCRLPTVGVEVGAKKARFLVDTGASTTVVDPALLGIPASWVDKARLRLGEPGLSRLGDVTVIKTLRIGEYVRKRWRAKALDLSSVSANCGKKFDGILGIDVLREFSEVILDFENEELRLVR